MKKSENVKKSNLKKSKPNKELMLVTTMFSILFFVMAGYLMFFLAFESEEVINNPYNHRQEMFARKVVRGSILTEDGTVLAESITGDDGEETRRYPFGRQFAHVVGYDTYGKSGVESQMNFNLLRSNVSGFEYLANEFRGVKNPGDDVVITLDVDLQKAAYDALGNHDGAVVILEPSTGKVLAMVSKPDFDPNTLSENWEELNGEDSSVLLNRATDGVYPPGSTFKIVTLLEYLRENPDYESYRYRCEGTIQGEDYYIQCHNLAVHGEQDLEMSFANSCNTSFVNLGMTLDNTGYRKTAESLLFNLDLPTHFPAAGSSFRLEQADSDFMKAQTVIGQGETLVTPLHMAMIAAAIENDGVLMEPYLVTKVVSETGKTVKSYEPSQYGRLFAEEEAKLMQNYMRQTVLSGTASVLSSLSYTAYGKTGTAQFGSDTNNHFWFVGFAEKDGKKLAVSVVIEDEQSYYNLAVTAAGEILQTYFEN